MSSSNSPGKKDTYLVLYTTAFNQAQYFYPTCSIMAKVKPSAAEGRRRPATARTRSGSGGWQRSRAGNRPADTPGPTKPRNRREDNQETKEQKAARDTSTSHALDFLLRNGEGLTEADDQNWGKSREELLRERSVRKKFAETDCTCDRSAECCHPYVQTIIDLEYDRRKNDERASRKCAEWWNIRKPYLMRRIEEKIEYEQQEDAEPCPPAESFKSKCVNMGVLLPRYAMRCLFREQDERRMSLTASIQSTYC